MIALGLVATSRRGVSTFLVKAIGVFAMSSRVKLTIFVVLALALATSGSSIEVARRQTDGNWRYSIDLPNGLE